MSAVWLPAAIILVALLSLLAGGLCRCAARGDLALFDWERERVFDEREEAA